MDSLHYHTIATQTSWGWRYDHVATADGLDLTVHSSATQPWSLPTNTDDSSWLHNDNALIIKNIDTSRVARVSSITNETNEYVSLLLCLKNAPTLKQYSSKLQGTILMIFGRNIQKTLEWSLLAMTFQSWCVYWETAYMCRYFMRQPGLWSIRRARV